MLLFKVGNEILLQIPSPSHPPTHGKLMVVQPSSYTTFPLPREHDDII